VYSAVSVSEPAARDAAGMVIVAEPELSAVAADV
jgi:RNA polymerase subunit RPABC4/transcription elongation factor Spt4